MDINLPNMRATLVRISQFVLQEESEIVRENLQEKVAEAALFWGLNENQSASVENLQKIAENVVHLKFASNLLEVIISRLIAKGSVVKDNAGNYTLSVIRRKEYARMAQERKERVDRFNGQFLFLLEKEYGRKLNTEQMKEGMEKLYAILGQLTIEKSDLIARIVTRQNVENLPYELNIHKLLTLLSKIEDQELRNAEFRAIKLLFRETSDDFYSFLFVLTQNLICIQILNLDPECRALEKKAFSEKALFLDTNILIGLVCPTDWQHKPAKSLLKFSSFLGIRCFVAGKTCEEYNSLLEEANKIFKKWEAPLKFLADANNEFLSSFWSEKQADHSLTWDSYYHRTKDVGKILSDNGIQPYVEDLEQINKNKHFETITEYVDECYVLLKRRTKNLLVCEHDATLLILIRNLRKQERNAMLGPNHWFITGDDSLLCVDNKINSLPDFADKVPSSMLFSIWLDMISPFLTIQLREGDAYETFTMLTKYQFALVPFQIDSDTLVKIQGNWTQYEWLEAKDIVRIQNQEWTKQYLRRLDEAKRKEHKSQAEEIGRIFADKLNQELTVIKDEKLKTLSEEKNALLGREELLSKTVQEKTKESDERQKIITAQKEIIGQKQSIIESKDVELEKENTFKRKLRTVITIAGLLLVIFTVLAAVYTISPMTFEKVSFYTVFLIVGAILLFFGLAPERVVVSIVAKLGFPQSK
jgi:hypothetical protein